MVEIFFFYNKLLTTCWKNQEVKNSWFKVHFDEYDFKIYLIIFYLFDILYLHLEFIANIKSMGLGYSKEEKAALEEAKRIKDDLYDRIERAKNAYQEHFQTINH